MGEKKQTPFIKFWTKFKKNKGALFAFFILVILLIVSFFGAAIAPFDAITIQQNALSIPPIWSEAGQGQYLLGTDDLGRDLFSRLVLGTKISMGIGFFVVIFSLLIGGVLGLLSGYFGGWLDAFVTRLVDLMMSLPSILLAIVVVSILGPSLTSTIFAVSVVSIPSFIRLARAAVMNEKTREYVSASLSYGGSHWRTLFVHIVPNCIAPLIVQATLSFSNAILDAAALGFLGLGAQPPTPEWGTMLADARPFIESAPWLVTLPGLCILVVVLTFNILGDGLRDALDPKVGRH